MVFRTTQRYSMYHLGLLASCCNHVLVLMRTLNHTPQRCIQQTSCNLIVCAFCPSTLNCCLPHSSTCLAIQTSAAHVD